MGFPPGAALSVPWPSADKLFIGGEWVEPAGDGHDRRGQPDHGGGRRPHPGGNAEDADRAVGARARRSTRGRSTSPEERAGYCAAIGAKLGERGDEIAAPDHHRDGHADRLARMIQAGLPHVTFSSMPELIEEVAWEEEVGNSLIVREPAGVVAAITPWNYPLHQIANKVAPALAAGCTVVLKPSEVAPLNAFVLAEIIEEVGLPAGRLQPGDRHGAGGRRGARVAPRDGHGLLHRLHARGQARHRAGGAGVKPVRSSSAASRPT